MHLVMFSIFDVKADTYNVPWFKPSVGLAVRDFGDLVNDKNTLPGRHPEDFKLVEIGVFDDQTGKVMAHETFTSLGFGTDYVRKE